MQFLVVNVFWRPLKGPATGCGTALVTEVKGFGDRCAVFVVIVDEEVESGFDGGDGGGAAVLEQVDLHLAPGVWSVWNFNSHLWHCDPIET